MTAKLTRDIAAAVAAAAATHDDEHIAAQTAVNALIDAVEGGSRIVPAGASAAAIQTELNAAGSSGQEVVLLPSPYTVNATLTIPDRVRVRGFGKLSELTSTAGGVPLITMGNQSALEHVKLLKGGTLRQAGSVGIDASNKSNVSVVDVRVEAFESGYKQVDTASTSFYSRLADLILWENLVGVDIGGTQANNNQFDNLRIRPLPASASAIGVRLVDVRGLLFNKLNVEPGGTAANNGTGVSLDAATRECTFVAPWLEVNNTNLTITAGANRNTFIGGTFTGGTTDVTNNGTATVFINCQTTGTRLHSVA